MIHKYVSVRFDGKGLEKTWSNGKGTNSKNQLYLGLSPILGISRSHLQPQVGTYKKGMQRCFED